MSRRARALTSVHEFDARGAPPGAAVRERDGLPQPHATWSRKAFIEGFYIKPRIDLELLREHARGADRALGVSGWRDSAAAAAGRLRGRKGVRARACRRSSARSTYYLELQDHGIREQAEVNQGMLRLARGDGHAAWCARTTRTTCARRTPKMQDVLHVHPDGQDRGRREPACDSRPQNFYLKLDGGDARRFSPRIRRRSKTRRESPRRCNVEFTFGKYHLPEFKLPDGLRLADISARALRRRALPSATARRTREVPASSWTTSWT